MANAHNQNASESQAKYFDLHTTGIGYLSRIRKVEPSKRVKDHYYACTINALRGSSGDLQYTRFDVNVTGEVALARVLELKKLVDAQRKVLVQFKLGDTSTEVFIQTKGKNTGNPACVTKGRLLQVKTAKVDGQDYTFVTEGAKEAPAPARASKAAPVHQSTGFDDTADFEDGEGFEAESDGDESTGFEEESLSYPPLDMAM